ncbi:MAG: hypothetical protein ACLTGG_05505 [Subdoligranulum sp.]
MLFLIQSAGCPAEYFYLLLSYPILPALASSAQRKTRQNARFSFGLHRTFPALQIQASMGGIDTQNYAVLLSNFTYVTIPKAMRLWYDDS